MFVESFANFKSRAPSGDRVICRCGNITVMSDLKVFYKYVEMGNKSLRFFIIKLSVKRV